MSTQSPPPATAADAAPMENGAYEKENSAYELFMGILSILSIGLMIWLVFVRDPLIHDILWYIDTLFCFIFLADFARSFKMAPSKRGYLFPRGIFDLLSSLPGLILVNVAIFRFFRVFRIFRVARILGDGGPRKVIGDFLANRAESAVYLIVLAVIIVITFGSIGEVYAEADAPGANITTAGDAIWWAFVTITTVGYGDKFPVTELGRIIGVITMATGIAIFGVVTSLLSAFMLGDKSEAEEADDAADLAASTAIADQMAAMRTEIAALRSTLARGATGAD